CITPFKCSSAHIIPHSTSFINEFQILFSGPSCNERPTAAGHPPTYTPWPYSDSSGSDDPEMPDTLSQTSGYADVPSLSSSDRRMTAHDKGHDRSQPGT